MLLPIILLLLIALRLRRAHQLVSIASSYLMSFLYLALFSYQALAAEVPGWLKYYSSALFGIGITYFAFLEIWETIMENRSIRYNFNDFKKGKGPLAEVLSACELLSENRLGALMILERRKSLSNWADKGTRIEAKLSRDLIHAIFTPPSALHDGATILSQDRIVASGVIVPLTKNTKLPRDLGTRHRAAVGFSEVSDGLCVIVSEESGAISFADRGILYYDIPAESRNDFLEKAMRFKLQNSNRNLFSKNLMSLTKSA